MPQYKMRHKQTGEIVIGTFEEICDLDKRLWGEPEEIVATLRAEGPLNKRLCSVRVHSDYSWKEIWKDIYNLSDLNNMYIGGQNV